MSEERRESDLDGIPGERRLPVVCRMLRTKTAFGTLEGLAHDWRQGQSTTAVYWCLRTMESWGTDDRPAEAARCLSGRACFEPEDAPGRRPDSA